MTRFEKWISQQDRVDLICNDKNRWLCKGCVLLPVCDKYKYARESEKAFRDECEAYLDEEVDE